MQALNTILRSGQLQTLRCSCVLLCKKFRSRSHDAVIRLFDNAGNVIDTHEHAGEFKEW